MNIFDKICCFYQAKYARLHPLLHQWHLVAEFYNHVLFSHSSLHNSDIDYFFLNAEAYLPVRKIVYSIKYSQAVTHPSTNLTRCCLT